MEIALVYILTALGGAALYCLLPRAGEASVRMRWAGGILGAAAAAAVLVYLANRFGGGGAVGWAFYTFAAIAIVAAARVVTHPKPAYCVIYFILVVVAVSGMLLLLAAEFLAIALVIIYGGAIIVTYVFVIMLAQQTGTALYDRSAREPFGAVLAGFLLAGTVAAQLADRSVGASTPISSPPLASRPEEWGTRRSVPHPSQATAEDGAPGLDEEADHLRAVAGVQETADPEEGEAMTIAQTPATRGNTAAIGEALLTKYVVTLEVAGILLLAAMVGGIMLARRPLPADVTRHRAGDEPGKAGREATPF